MTTTVADTLAPRSDFLLRRMMTDEPRFTLLGIVLALALVPVLAAMALEPRTYEDVNVWIKPAKFLLSLSLYTLNLAFFARFLPPRMTGRFGYRIFASIVVFCILAEIAWIAGAAAMGVGSHFNRSTPAMAILYSTMGVFAVMLTFASLVYGVAILRHRSGPLAPALRLSIGLGLVLTFVMTVPVALSMAMGQGNLVGTPVSGASLPLMGWSREVGDLRVAHFFATHAMQMIPLFGLLVLPLTRRLATAAVWLVALGYVAVVVATFLQGTAGQPFLPWLG